MDEPAIGGLDRQIDVTAQARIPVELFTDPVAFSISIAKTTGWAVNDIEASYHTAHRPPGPSHWRHSSRRSRRVARSSRPS